ncbi:PilW family protein [Clostridium hydrogenum]|uniref:PilW family protein n=1 Tax=Clostridium hydrogenum TaxID=2855764 RepID=UPI001F16246A|nr:prepilin-type N-terminal cleavage/methylation domain-containing protein [Clostridium hydrogenum]
MENYKKLKGFTLIELMACVAIFAILTTTLGLFFESMLKLYNIQEANTTIEYDARRVMTSITQDVRSAASVPDTGTNSNKLILNNADGSVMATYSLDPNSTNTLDKSGKEIANDISSIAFKVDSKTDPGTVYVTLTAQKKNTYEKFTISSSVKRPSDEKIAVKTPPAPTPTPTPSSNMDLDFLERNVINVISSGDFDLKATNGVAINTGTNDNLFFQCKNFVGSDLASSNIQGNLAIKADSMDWGNSGIAICGKEAVFDVPSFSGTSGPINNCKVYYNDNYSAPSNLSGSYVLNKTSQYPSSGDVWSGMFDSNNKSSIKAMSLNNLKPNIDFSKYPNINASSIHYFKGLSNNEIAAGVPKPLPDYKGAVQACSISLSNYEYIICHGPLTISSKDSNGNYDWNKNFNFKGLIYCDDVITFKDIIPAFTGIIISKGIVVDSPQRQNWNGGNGGINFDNNNGNLKDINSILDAETVSSN